MRTMIKRAAALVLAAAMTVGLCACGAGKEGDIKANDLVEITFCLDWTPNTNHTGIYAAQELGYYKEAGLSVKIVQPPEDGAATMCASGQAQFAVDAQDTMAAALDQEDALGITAVAGMIAHNTSGIISRKGDGIDRPKGLEGKTYSTWESPTEIATLQTVVEEDGGDFSKVKMIPNNITDEPAALQANRQMPFGFSTVGAVLMLLWKVWTVITGALRISILSSTITHRSSLQIILFCRKNRNLLRSSLLRRRKGMSMRLRIRKKQRIC